MLARSLWIAGTASTPQDEENASRAREHRRTVARIVVEAGGFCAHGGTGGSDGGNRGDGVIYYPLFSLPALCLVDGGTSGCVAAVWVFARGGGGRDGGKMLFFPVWIRRAGCVSFHLRSVGILCSDFFSAGNGG